MEDSQGWTEKEFEYSYDKYSTVVLCLSLKIYGNKNMTVSSKTQKHWTNWEPEDMK